METRVVLFQECRGHALDNSVEAALIKDEVVVIAEHILGQVIACNAEHERALQWVVVVLEIWIIALRQLMIS